MSKLVTDGERDLSKIVYNYNSRHGRNMNIPETLKVLGKSKEEILTGRWQINTIEQKLKLAIQRSKGV